MDEVQECWMTFLKCTAGYCKITQILHGIQFIKGERREGGKLSKSETKLYFTYHSVLTQELNFLGMQLLCKLRETLPRTAVHSENQITVWQCHFSYLSGQYNTHLSVYMCRCCIQSFCL